MSTKRSFALLGICLTVWFVFAWLSVAGAGSGAPASAAAQVERVTGKSPAKLVPQMESNLASSDALMTFVNPADASEFWFERKTGRLRYYSNTKAYGRGTVADKGADWIIAAAERQVRRAYDPERLKHMTRTIEREVHGDEVDYVVSYQETVDGVPTFNTVRMIFMTDGVLANYLVDDCDVEVSLEPDLAQEDAVVIAGRQSEFQRWSSECAELRAIRTDEGAQYLVWEVELRTGDCNFGATSWSLIDAHTGAVINTAIGE